MPVSWWSAIIITAGAIGQRNWVIEEFFTASCQDVMVFVTNRLLSRFAVLAPTSVQYRGNGMTIVPLMRFAMLCWLCRDSDVAAKLAAAAERRRQVRATPALQQV